MRSLARRFAPRACRCAFSDCDHSFDSARNDLWGAVMIVDMRIRPSDLQSALHEFFGVAGRKIRRLNRAWDPAKGSPVFTRAGKYTSRGWTEWTQGFQFGCQILQFDATNEAAFLKMGRENTLRYMAPHVSHVGVHDHGFNNVSTYGNLRRLAREGRTKESSFSAP